MQNFSDNRLAEVGRWCPGRLEARKTADRESASKNQTGSVSPMCDLLFAILLLSPLRGWIVLFQFCFQLGHFLAKRGNLIL